MKSEALLQHTWKFQLFNSSYLLTDEGLPLSVIKPGYLNTDSGPDFQQSRLIIDGLEWVGQVEIHIKASDWLKHQHQNDPNYNNVILHVVWENDQAIYRKDGSLIPTLSLQKIIDPHFLSHYQKLVESNNQIACEPHFYKVESLKKVSMFEKALARRLERKANHIFELFKSTNHDLEATAYLLLMKNFGFKLNAAPFEHLAQITPYSIVQKLHGLQVEALLFGQAGFLNNCTDTYALGLLKEYEYLIHKFEFPSNQINAQEWKFLRTRPQNFPTVRLAQIAAILSQSPYLFSSLIEEDQPSFFKQIQISEYWQKHYNWGKETKFSNKIGNASIENLIINTSVPLMAFYYYLTDQQIYWDRAIQLLETLQPENNYITRIWNSLHVQSISAFDSQAQIEQYNELCLNKKCLQCTVGISILQNRRS